MSSTSLMAAAVRFDGAGDDSPDSTLRSLAVVVRELAHSVDTMWSQHPTDGPIALRLIEASHSLHRAAIALQDDALVGHVLRS